ncbi:hypothetical protein HSX11_19055 [Oxalobacteraceae bacterium]|nr:hypothetical protein [Oxalobacteraceae bacterium]
MSEAEWKMLRKLLRYDKGENRRKHSGHHADARMVHKFGAWIGECPKGFHSKVALELVWDGFPEFRSTTSEHPYRVWNYYDGAIYAARSVDGGVTWHGYPSGPPADEPPRAILRQLNARAREQGEELRLKQWLKKRWGRKV